MDNNLIVDSCTDFSDDRLFREDMERVPFIITVDDEEIIDKDLDTNVLISKMKASTSKIGTACPSPNDYLTAFKEIGQSFVVTISSKLSASYNSAVVAKDIFEDENPDCKIHVFDSESAAAGESMVALKVKQLVDIKLPFDQIIEKTNQYIANLKTYFILNSLDNLAKNGRISQTKAFIGNILNITPIMGDNGSGEIELKAQVKGKNKAMEKLIEMVGEANINFKNTTLGITHVDAFEKAEALKNELQKRYNFKDIIIFKSGGLSTVYADDGGIVLAF